ncbi:VanZ family protein, partial [Acinetobacter baumannii]
AFATLGMLGWRAYPARPWAVPIGLLLYGSLIEWLQWMTPYRSADGIDVLADALGLAAEMIALPLEAADRYYHRLLMTLGGW